MEKVKLFIIDHGYRDILRRESRPLKSRREEGWPENTQ